MTTAAYLELAITAVEKTFATAGQLADGGFGFRTESAGHVFDFAAPGQFVGKDEPVMLQLIRRSGNNPQTAQQQQLLSPGQALFELMKRLAKSNLSYGVPQKAKRWLADMRHIKAYDVNPKTINQALQMFRLTPKQRDTIFAVVDRDGSLRRALFNARGPAARPAHISSLKLVHSQTPSSAAPVAPAMSATKKWIYDQIGTPFRTIPAPYAA